MIFIFVAAWFLLSVLASNVGKKKGYYGWLFFLASTVFTIGVIFLGASRGSLEVAACVAAWLCPLLVTGVAFLMPEHE